MIVCHCNRLTSGDIDDSVCCLMRASCQRKDLCAETVYEELGACPQCCGCLELAEKIIDQSRLAFLSREALATLRQDASGNPE